MKRIYKLPLVLEPQPEAGYTILGRTIPELVTEADTLDEVQAHVADALAALLELYADTGKPVPDWGRKDQRWVHCDMLSSYWTWTGKSLKRRRDRNYMRRVIKLIHYLPS